MLDEVLSSPTVDDVLSAGIVEILEVEPDSVDCEDELSSGSTDRLVVLNSLVVSLDAELCEELDSELSDVLKLTVVLDVLSPSVEVLRFSVVVDSVVLDVLSPSVEVDRFSVVVESVVLDVLSPSVEVDRFSVVVESVVLDVLSPSVEVLSCSVEVNAWVDVDRLTVVLDVLNTSVDVDRLTVLGPLDVLKLIVELDVVLWCSVELLDSDVSEVVD